MKLSHVRLLVDDVPATAAFYRDVLGFEVRADHGAYIELATGEVSLSVFTRSGQAETVELRGPGDGALLNIAVENVDAELERLADHVVGGPLDRPDWGLRVGYLRDPAGTLVELYHEIPMTE